MEASVYFEKKQFANLSSDVSFVGPQVTQCFKLLSADEAKVLIEPLCLMDKRLVFFAVNDNMSRDNTGGSHWSLLVLSILDKVCQHYDSMNQGNEDSAVEIFRILKPMFGGDLRFEHGECPQQRNSHDCGVYVICVTEYICSQRLNPSKTPVAIDEAVNSQTVSRKRDEFKEIIHNLAKCCD